jgi:uncharacterized coiled-coil DUF342 family protein
MIITGISQPDLTQIRTRFRDAGMAESVSIEKNGRQLDMGQWHDRFCSASSWDEAAPGPGKFAEQLAGELFFANMETPLWGWADARSSFLLDFWAEFDPRMVFVLTCCPLDHYLARLMETRDAASLDLDALVDDWQQCHAHLLRFYHTHPDRCLLVEIHDCAMQFNALIQACRDKWDLPLTDIPEPGPAPYPFPAPLARHIAAGFTGRLKEAESLWNEIQATVSTLAPDTSDTPPPDDVSFSQVAQSFQTLKDRSEEFRRISGLEEQLEDKSGKVDTLEEQIAALEKELAQKDTRYKDLAQKNKEISEENDLILLQLHQVQEELESIFLKKQETERQFAALQKELEQKDTRFKELEQKNQALNKEKEQTSMQLQSLRDEHKKTMQESEQRLYQLHEAQEKLGHYLIKYQEQTKQLEKAEARWERLLKRTPDYCDYGDVRIIQGEDGTGLICEVRDLEVGAQTYPELEFETFVVGGVAGFRFKHPDHITQGDLIPVAQTSEDAKKQSQLLKGLSTSEWGLLHATAQFLKTCLKTETFDEDTLPASLIQTTLNGLDRFSEVIARFPQTLRFDEIHIDEKTLSKDCEHLEICLENLSCGDLDAPEFVFRLSCAGLESSEFGSNPRLEFPEETGIILKNWFDSSNNPDDPRLELRFALPEAMDMEVWNQLSREDAEFVRMLISHLPALVEENDPSSGLEASKWVAVARNVAQIFKRRTQTQEVRVA